MTCDTISRPGGYVPFVHLGDGYPVLSGDVLRNLRRGAQRLIRDQVHDVIRFRSAAADLARLRPLITAAYVARNRAAGRPVDEAAWDRLYDQAGQVATLELDGHLAAWELAVLEPPEYRVLAGQMADGWGRYRPGRLLEEAILRWLLDNHYTRLDWGSSEHPETLLAVT